MELSQKLKELRKKQGLTQLELAERLFVSRQAISGWEAGTSRPSTENLQSLSRLFKATPRNDMKKPHHLPISANCGGGSAYFRCMGKLNQAGKQRLSARIRFASANNIFNFAVCFRRPRYRVFRYRNRPFTTPKTCSTFARTDDFSCSLRFN